MDMNNINIYYFPDGRCLHGGQTTPSHVWLAAAPNESIFVFKFLAFNTYWW